MGTGYGAPAAGYGAPDTGYGAPASGYDAPATGYDEPAAPGYGATGVDEVDSGPGILPFVAVILSIIGLSLLFPAVVNISGRKKRSLGEGKQAHCLQCSYQHTHSEEASGLIPLL